MAQALTVQRAIEAAADRLAQAGIERARLDAELLLRHVLGWDRARLTVAASEPVSAEALARFEALVTERARRRPLQHLTGVQAFWRQELLVSPDVLIPRPETELIVEAALLRLRGRRYPRIVDVGTGSGCVALALASELPDAEIHATDLSPAALSIARRNAERLGLAARVQFHEGDLLGPVAVPEGRFDLVASNPPYVDPAHGHLLAPEVRDQEPAMALFPPGEPLSIYRRLAPQAAGALAPGGYFIVEIGLGMDAAVVGILEGAGLCVEEVLKDLQKIPRTVVARRGT